MIQLYHQKAHYDLEKNILKVIDRRLQKLQNIKKFFVIIKINLF